MLYRVGSTNDGASADSGQQASRERRAVAFTDEDRFSAQQLHGPNLSVQTPQASVLTQPTPQLSMQQMQHPTRPYRELSAEVRAHLSTLARL